MSLPIVQVDAFTSVPFSGNPAAVCVLPEERDSRWMQKVAREMNLSETAFLRARPDGFSLRWFTPAVEVDLCGHATLASAHVLWESGLLTAVRHGDWIEMDFPSTAPEGAEPPPGLLEALGVSPRYIGKSRFDYLLELETEEAVRKVRPDFARLTGIGGVRGVIVTSRSATTDRDFVSRFFAPAVGVNEDPVTGSAHCCLAPFWSSRLKKNDFIAHQLSERGGILKLRTDGSRVGLKGQAVTVLEGQLLA